MGLHADDNSLRNFKLGLFVKPPPAPLIENTMEDDEGNVLEDDEGNVLIFPE